MDDLGWKDLQACGSTFYETPNIDRLMSEGMQFSNGFASCPVCSPSRGSLLTGKSPARLGLTDWIDNAGVMHPLKGKFIDAPYVKNLSHEEKTLPSTLREHGYSTYHIGKWHLGTKEHYPETHGFDVNIGGCSWGHPHEGYFSPYNLETLKDGPEGEYLTDRLTDEAIKLIKNSKDKPFFMNLCHYAVHTPIEAPAELIKKFEQKAKKLGLDSVNALVEGEEMLTDDKRGKKVTRRILQSDPAYAAMIYNLDWNIGRTIEALKAEGVYESTIIIFTSDNGGLATAEGSPTCNFPASEGKGWTKDGGLRVPLSITWKNEIRQNSLNQTPVTGMDFYPTLLEACGIDLLENQHKDGVSLMPLLKESSIGDRYLYWHYPHYGNQGGHPSVAVRKGRYKLIKYYDMDKVELFDIENDLSEITDISGDKPRIVADFLSYLEHTLEDCEAKYPSPNPNWKG